MDPAPRLILGGLLAIATPRPWAGYDRIGTHLVGQIAGASDLDLLRLLLQLEFPRAELRRR
jgi:hypothetical protein